MPFVSKARARAACLAGAAVLFPSVALPAGAANGSAEEPSFFSYPTSLSGNFIAGRVAGARRDTAKAVDFFRDALAADPRNVLLLERTFALSVAEGRVREAIALADRVLTRDKGNRLARLVLGVDQLKRGNFDRARSQFSQGGQGPLADLSVAILTAWTRFGAGDTDQALAAIDKLGGPDWYGVFKNYHAGLINDLAGRKAEAVKRLAAAHKADPTGLRVTEAHARALARAGRRDEALAVIEEFEKAIPDHPVMRDLATLIEAGKTPGPTVATAQAGAAEFLYGFGAALGREADEAAAIHLQLALYLEPKSELPLLSLASLHAQLKQYEKAVAALSRIPADSRLRPLSDMQIGRYYSVLERFDEARKHLEEVVKRMPKDVDALMALGDVLRANKKYAEASEVYSRAIEALGPPKPTDWALFYNRGIAYERIKEWPKAEADFKKALQLNPDEPHVLNYLGYSWVDLGMNYDEALNLIRKAVEKAPDDGYIVDSLGWAYFKLGRYEDAVRELERAVLLKPDDPVINDHLGDAYWKVDRKLEGTFQWRHALDRKPEPEDLARIEKKLADGLAEEKPATAARTEADAAVEQPATR